jgi:hypothetical protein
MPETWGRVMLSSLLLLAAPISPRGNDAAEFDEHFRSTAVGELLYGFPTCCGFEPHKAPTSLPITSLTIICEWVWYPARGGVWNHHRGRIL